MVSGSSQRGGSLSFSFAWGTQIWCLINAKCLTDFLAGRKRITWLLSTYVSPANLQPWRFRWWRSHAQVLHEIHPPSLLAWMRSSSSPTFPENRRHFFLLTRTVFIPWTPYPCKQHRELSSPPHPRSWPVSQVTSESCRRLLISGAL